MGLQSANFVDAVVKDQLMTDFRRSNELLNVLLGSAKSREVEAQAIAAGGSDGFAKKLVLPLLKQAALNPTDGYTTISAFPSGDTTNPDLSSAYAIPTDESILFNVNKYAIGTHFLPELEKWTHAAGSVLSSGKVAADLQEIRDVIEEGIIADMFSSTVFASISAGAGSRFPLVTSAEADLLADLADLEGEFNRQNLPREGRWLALPAAKEGLAVKWGGLSSTDYPGIGDRASGTLQRIAGFNIIYTNSLGSTEAVAFSDAAYALVMPKGIQVESLRDKDRIGDYTRIYTMFGIGAVKEVVLAADGSSPTHNAQRSGIVAITVS